MLPRSDRLLDLLHQISFKDSLQRSIYPIEGRLGDGWFRRVDVTDDSGNYMTVPQLYETRVTVAEVAAYRDMMFVHDNITVFTNGLSDVESQAITDSLAAYTAKGGARVASSSQFVSSESRIPTSAAASGWVGFPGAANGSEQSLALDILAKATGGKSCTYEGAGLFAVPHSGNPAAQIKNMLSLSDDEINYARDVVSNEHSFAADDFDGAVTKMLNGNFSADYKNVSNSAVKEAAAALAKGPKSLVVEGSLSGSDHLSDL